MAPRDPQKRKKSILMGSLVVLDPNGSPKKISSIFGTGCHKVCTCLLNGAIVILYFRLIASKLVSYVPIFELEDAILKPFFGSVLDYLEETIKILEETTADTKVNLFPPLY